MNWQAKEDSANALHLSSHVEAMLDLKQDRLLGKKEMSHMEETKPNHIAVNMTPAWILHVTWNIWLYFLMQRLKLIENTSASLHWIWVARENTARSRKKLLLIGHETLPSLVSDTSLKTLWGKQSQQQIANLYKSVLK